MIKPDPYAGDSQSRPLPGESPEPDVLDLVQAEIGVERWDECVRIFLTTALIASEVQADPRSFDFGFEMGVRCALQDPEALRLYALATSYGRQCSGNLETDVKVTEAVEFMLGDGALEASSSA